MQPHHVVETPGALALGFIKECVPVLNQERDKLSTLEGISEAWIARHGLPAGLMARIKASMETWRRAGS